MRNSSTLYIGILLLVSALWGFSFVAQRSGMEYVGPYTFNGVRFALGVFSLLPLYIYLRNKSSKEEKETVSTKIIWKRGFILGFILFIAASLQQIGMQYTTAANGGFITSLYVVLVPFFSVLLKRKIPKLVWVGSSFALIGLYLLSFSDGLYLGWGDSFVLMSAIFWAIHVMLISKYATGGSIVLLSMIQFGITAIFSLIIAFIIETVLWSNIKDAGIPILYGGVVSVGIAYTLQVFAQKKVAPEQSAIILSFESAFALIGGWLILNESLGLRSLIGAGFMMLGVIISQIKRKKR